MNRKEFLTTSLGATLGVAILPQLWSCTSQRTVFEVLKSSKGDISKIRGNVSSFTNRGGTVGLLETKDSFVVIDAQFPDFIQPLINSISQVKGKPIEFLCNTHHHGDHTAGNFAFKNLTQKIVAQKNVPELQKNAAELAKNVDKQVYANILFEDQYLIKSGGERVTAYHFGAGHTFGDAMYHFEKDNVVHMGDLMFINMIPVYRVKDGSNFRSWISVLEKAISTFDKDTLFIFGHAPDKNLTKGNLENLTEMRNFLEASADFIKKSLAEGKTTEQLTENLVIPKFEHRKAMNKDFTKTFIEGIASQL